MKINAINNKNFEAKKFRLPVKIVEPTTKGSMTNQYIPKNSTISGNFVKEYSNPNAEKLFNKAMNTKDIDKKLQYLEEMGDYKIINIDLEKNIDKFIKSKI